MIEKLSFLSNQQVVSLAEHYGTPLFVYDENSIIKNIRYINKIPSAFGKTIRFSVKSNPNRNILKLVDNENCHFDVSSIFEAIRVIKAGIDPKKILLTSQELTSGWEELAKKGVKIDAGSLRQIELYGKEFPNTTVSLRINPGIGSGLVNKLTSGGEGSSFGIWYEDIQDAIDLVEKYNLTVERLHFHIGSGHESKILLLAIDKMLEFCELINTVSILNTGGGYRTKVLSTDPEYDHLELGRIVSEKIENFYKKTGRKLKLELEPGTYIMAMSGSLITRVIDKTFTGENGFNFIKIDAGLTEVIRTSYYGDYHPIVTVKKSIEENNDNNNIQKYIVCGHCCIAGDNFMPEPGSNAQQFSPKEIETPEINDFIVIERAGGYCSSMSIKNFNSFPETAEVLLTTNGESKLIRKRQTIEQIIENEVDYEK